MEVTLERLNLFKLPLKTLGLRRVFIRTPLHQILDLPQVFIMFDQNVVECILKTWISLEQKEVFENGKQQFSSHTGYLFMI